MDDYLLFQVKAQDNLHLLLSTEDRCPECGCEHFDFDGEYNLCCQNCGLVLAAIHPYVAGERIDLPWGLLL